MALYRIKADMVCYHGEIIRKGSLCERPHWPQGLGLVRITVVTGKARGMVTWVEPCFLRQLSALEELARQA